ACERDRAARFLPRDLRRGPGGARLGHRSLSHDADRTGAHTLLRNLKHNKVLHQTVLLVRVVTENIPRVAGRLGEQHDAVIRSDPIKGGSDLLPLSGWK